MPTLNIEGRRVKVDDSFLSLSPEQKAQTVDEIAAQIGVKPGEAESQQSQDLRGELSALTQAGRVENPAPKDAGGILQSIDSGMRGAADIMSFGMADEIAGTGNYLVKKLNPFGDGPVSLADEIQQERDIQAYRDEANPVASTVGRVAGGVTQGVGMAKNGLSLLANAPRGAGVVSLAGRGAAEGAAYGAAYGLGSGDGVSDRLSQATGGAVMGGVIGGAVPVIAATGKAIARPITDAISARINPEAFANRKVIERLADGGMDAAQAAAKMAAGNRMSLADVGGKPVRSLLRTAANIPGKGQDAINKTVTIRQMGQGDRLKSIVGQTFADPDGYLAAKDEIADTAKRLAAPLYRKAYETPVHFSQELEGILKTPAGSAALRKAEEIAANEQAPFRQMFVEVFDDGTKRMRRVPDARAWDYIKRGMDDVIEGQTDALTGKVTTSGRAVLGLKNRMLEELDRLNPAYKAARRVWAGQQQLDNALEFGRKAMSMSPEAVRRQVAGMSAAEKEAARAGMAEWVRNSVDKAGFTNNAILRFFGNRNQIQTLRAMFDSPQQFTEFRKAVFAEARKRATYEAVKGNSTTVAQLADMADAGGLQEAVGAARNAVTSGPVNATLQWLGSRLKMLGGLTPDVADKIGKKLLSSDPAKVRQIATELRRIEAAQIASQEKARLVQSALTRALALPAQSMALQPQ